MDAYVWILVIDVISLFPGDLRMASSRTRGLTESACLILAQEVRSSMTIAYCYEDGTLDPEGRTRPVERRPICGECGPLPGRKRV